MLQNHVHGYTYHPTIVSVPNITRNGHTVEGLQGR